MGIHSREGAGGSRGRDASAPWLNEVVWGVRRKIGRATGSERSAIHSRGAQGGSGGCDAAPPRLNYAAFRLAVYSSTTQAFTRRDSASVPSTLRRKSK